MTNVIATAMVRHQGPAPRAVAGKAPPLAADHPLVLDTHVCAACGTSFLTGEVTTIIVLGPGEDRESQEAARDGRAYTAQGVVVHYQCATGVDGKRRRDA
jgi:hypothetical protein